MEEPHPDQSSRRGSSGMVPIAVFISGSGRTLRNLASQIESGLLPAEIVLVVASKECPGAVFAREQDIRTVVTDSLESQEAVGDLLGSTGAQWAVLAGYIRLLPIPDAFRGRVVNIHPSLLPRHGGKGMYGHRVHASVLAAGDSESGCTVHLADGAYDRGEILAQAKCPVKPDDTPESLAARVFELETELYPRALADLFLRRP